MNHWAIQGGLALAIAALAAVVALWAPGRRFIGISIAAVTIYLGIASYRFPDAAGAYGQTWSVLSVAWAVVTAILALSPGSAR